MHCVKEEKIEAQVQAQQCKSVYRIEAEIQNCVAEQLNDKKKNLKDIVRQNKIVRFNLLLLCCCCFYQSVILLTTTFPCTVFTA